MNFITHTQIKITIMILILSIISITIFSILLSKKNKTLMTSIPNKNNYNIFFNGLIISTFISILMLFILLVEKTNWKGLGTI